jgi:multiple sugar transport system permease protein
VRTIEAPAQPAAAGASVTAAQRRGRARRLLREIWRNRWAYLFLLPFYSFFTLFFLVPLFQNLTSSLHRVGIRSSTFIGLENFERLAADPTFAKAVFNTVVLVAALVPIVMVVGIGIAAIARPLSTRWQSYFRLAFYLPVVASAVVLTVVWKWILNPIYGLLNFVLGLFGIEPIVWLGSTEWALIAVLIVVASFSIGTPIILFMAGLNAIPHELYEAANIDGASPWQEFRHISLPLLRPTTAFVLIVTTIGTFQVFVVIQLLTRGGPANATQTIVYRIWETAFTLSDFGYAAAMSVVLLAIAFIIALVQMRLVSRDVAY